MYESSLIQYIAIEWQNTSWIEVMGVFFAVCEVLLAYKNKIWLYPAGIISTSIYIWIFVQPSVKLYADASLNIYYLAMSIYGWIFWSRRNAKQEEIVKVSRASQKELQAAIGIVTIAFILLYLVLNHWTDSNTPVWDAFVSATAWAGMWLLAKRKIENWILLNISNATAIPLLFYKHLPLTALLTAFLFIVAVLGYLKWNRIIKKEKNANQNEATLENASSTRKHMG